MNEKQEGTKTIKADFGQKKIYIAIGIVGVLIILSFIWIMIESTSGGKFTFTNKSDYKIEYMKATFVNDEWQLSDTMNFENVASKSKDTLDINDIDLNNTQASLQLKIKFEGYDEFVLDAGYFDDLFTGNINIILKQSKQDQVDIYIKAKNSLLSSKTTNCDEYYTIYVKEGYIE
jgi:hypothetical protein